MLLYALWCVLEIYTLHSWWWLYVLDDDCAYLMMIIHTRWWLFILDDYSTYWMVMVHTWWRWCTHMMMQAEKNYLFSDCVWRCAQGCTWAVCGSDIYRGDLTMLRLQMLSIEIIGFYMWQVHKFDNNVLQGGRTRQGKEVIASFRLKQEN